MENELNKPRKRRLTLEDCLEDWTHCPIYYGDEVVYESFTEEDKEQMRQNSFGYSAFKRIDEDTCYGYFVFDYNSEKIDQYFKEHNWTERDIQEEGLSKMFNDGWIKSPAYVNWKNDLYSFIEPHEIEHFLVGISDYAMRVQILQFIVDNAEYMLHDDDIKELPFYEYLLSVYRIDAQFRMQEKEYKELLQSVKPQQGDYNATRKYMEAKIKTDPAFKNYCNTHPLKDVCEKLEAELHIDINVDSFRRNVNRSKKHEKTTKKDNRTK